MVTYDEALKASLEYFHGDELAAKVFLDKYALKDNEQNLLEKTPEDMHRRIAKEFARVEKDKFKKPLSEEEIFGYLHRFKKIVPQGGPSSGIGNTYQVISLSNCFVLESPVDSYAGILKTDEQLVQISKRRGGVGLDISHLRPNGTATRNAARTSTGIISFMERYSNSIREVGQSGRRGALMLTISVHHPEVVEFAKVKSDLKKVTGANISIRLSDEFLRAVEKDADYELRWPVDSEKPKISQKVNARSIWKEIIVQARNNAEPGLLFWDNIIKESPADCYREFGFETTSTNPCGEIPLCPFDSCRLLCINLFAYVKNAFTKESYYDFKELYHDAQIAQRLMDDMIDLEMECIDKIIYKIKEDPENIEVKGRELELWQNIKKKCENGRRTGTGITAIGDAMAGVGIKYGSEESIEFTEKIYKTLKFGAYRSSVNMAKELGAFKVWNHELEKDCRFLKRIKQESLKLSKDETISGEELWEEMRKVGRRNIALLTTAPTGTVSIVTQTSSGIEPVFQLSYTRRKKVNPNDKETRVDFTDDIGDKWQEFTVYHQKIKDWMAVTGEKNIEKSPWFGGCAEDLKWGKRVELQAAAQKHIDHAISSTLNLPENVSVEKVAEIYETAWKAGCKGVTIYRKNCRSGVLVDKKEEKKDKIVHTQAPKRPKVLPCNLHHVTITKKLDKVRSFEYLVIVGLFEGEPYEIFVMENGHLDRKYTHGNIMKNTRGHYVVQFDDDTILDNITKNTTEYEDSITRMTSTALRHGAGIEFVVHQLEKAEGDMYAFSKALARSLKKYIKDGTKVTGETCSNCSGSNIQRVEGCLTCKDCGQSKCG